MPRTPAPNKSRKATKSAAKSAASVPAKTPQAHGGALLTGGMPGNIGGGRTPNHVRQMAVNLGISKALPKLEAILDDATSTKQEIISAAREVLGVIPRKDEVNLADDPRVQATIRRVAEIVLELAGPEIHAAVSARLTAEGL